MNLSTKQGRHIWREGSQGRNPQEGPPPVWNIMVMVDYDNDDALDDDDGNEVAIGNDDIEEDIQKRILWRSSWWCYDDYVHDDNHDDEFAEMMRKQARKSSEDAQATGYAQFEKVWAG